MVVQFALFLWSGLHLGSALNVSAASNVRPPRMNMVRSFLVRIIAVCLTSHAAPIPSAAVNRTVHLPSVTSVSSEGFSRVSTPPTEVSDSLNSPALFPPLNPQEVMRRRAQSDMASSEIGKRMLQGWAMLAEECPNDSCYGVPLIRPPKVNGREDPRKVNCHCFICISCDFLITIPIGMRRLRSCLHL